MSAPNRPQPLRHSFVVVECTMPDAMTIQEWQRIKVTRGPRRRRLFK